MTAVLDPSSRPLRLPDDGGSLISYAPRGVAAPHRGWSGARPTCRQVYAAAHVVVDPLREPGDAGAQIDWDTTLAFRHHLWSLGLGVADAMDTAQRGGGLSWPQAKELIRRGGAEAQAVGGALTCGAGTDQLDPCEDWSLQDIAAAYIEQVQWVQQSGGVPVLFASRLLSRQPRTAEQYAAVYGQVLAAAEAPVILHWLGETFDPSLAGYWGSTNLDVAGETVLGLIAAHGDRVAGIKVSLLDAEREVALRRRLPHGVRMFTGDDLNYDRLILGDDHGHSDALLGVFDPLAVTARAALGQLDAGDVAGYEAYLEPTVPLARHIFGARTSAYKTGVVFLAWLNGHQTHFHMLGGAQAARSVPHLARTFVLADQAGVLSEPDLAVHRMRSFLAVSGIED